MKRQFASALILIFTFTGCSMAPQINSAGDLVAELQKEGLPIASQEPAPTPKGRHFRFDEGITLKGEDVWINVLRISDRKVYDIAKDASGLLVITEAAAGQELPGKPDIYTRYPFMVIIRQQPEGADLMSALKTILPPEEA